MSTGIVNYQKIAHVNLRKCPVHRKLIIVLAKRTDDVIYMICRSILLPHNGNVMVSTVHRWSHQIYRTRIHTDVLLVNVLLMDCSRNKAAIRCKHEASKLGKDCNLAKTIRH